MLRGMERRDVIERVLTAHEIAVRMTGPWGETSRLRIAMPDLRSAPRRVWGDWGPMYTVSVPPDRTVHLWIWTPGDAAPAHETLRIDRLRIDSPASASTRAITPLVVELPVPRRRLILQVAYDTHGRPAKAALLPLAGAHRDYGSCQVVDEREMPVQGDARLAEDGLGKAEALAYGRHA